MAPSSTALALCVALLLIWWINAEKLARPMQVRFAAETAHHLLRWEPGHNLPSDVHYEVEYKVYGMNTSWTAIPNCMKISGHFCDLTFYTLGPAQRYYARVRAVSRNHTSPWQRTNSFSPQEASLRLSGQSLSVMGNSIQVQLQLLLRAGNLTVKYDDIQKHARLYRVYVKRAQDNWTYEETETTPEFNISNLSWDTVYCISVEPDVASRPTRTTRTDEQCVTIGERDRSTELVLSIGSSFVITLLLLGLLGALLVCTYLKKPVRPPSVLVRQPDTGSLWMEESSSSSGSQDTDPIQQLFLCQKEPQQTIGPNSSTSTGLLPLEEGWRLPAWPEDWLCLLGSPGSGDSSCTSTDSGICLHTSSSSELSCSSGPQPHGYKRQLPTGDDSGVGLETTCRAQDLAPQREATVWDFSNLLGPRAPTLLSYGAPAAPFTSKTGPEVLKTPFDLSIFNTDLLGTPPLISSLSTDKWLTPQVNPLSLLNGDSKDSRL
ncbi:PREDICTED: interleukin-10 receptor subunit alpha [Buceros rhinoceros silvestris]|uniref:interleukin-10 receptor subunit alpha n=1 Tax=Buceros rhinoceros silvestris TaxID=175836 RepID=UPI0005291253|nr:PREDICTED: interleukin-10 receptor subunit alpha [Buceros rhinoceros silvestris]